MYRLFRFSIRKRYVILTAISALLLLSYFLPPSFGLNLVQQRTLFLLIISIVIWTTDVLPSGISALFVIGLELFMGIAENFSAAIQGFMSSTIYFILIVALISATMTKVGIDKRLAAIIVRFSHGKIRRVALSFFTATMVLPVFIPSGNARVHMFVPLVEQIGQQYGPQARIPFQRFAIWTLGGINQLATMVVLSGGGLAVLASHLVAELNVQLNWLTWFLFMAPPIWLTCILTGLIMWNYWKIKEIPSLPSHPASETGSDDRHPHFWLVTVSLIGLILAWVVVPEFHVSILLPPLLLLGILAMPGIDLLNNRDLRNYDWENFLVLGTALSLAAIIEKNGTADWVTGVILSFVGQHLPNWLYLLVLLVIVLFIRMMFTSPAAALTVIYPLVKSYADWVGLNPLHTLLLTILVASGMLILPIHSPIMYLVYRTGHIKIGEHLFISTVQLFFTIIVGLCSYMWYWPLVTAHH
jgi:anion transporter